MGLMTNPLDDGTTKKSVLGQDVFTANTTTMDPALRTVNAEKESVQGQLAGIMKSDSPVMQQARTGAMQTANSRGLLNSSLAAGAGEDAVIRNSLPVAGADADIYGTASRENQAATNRSMEFNAGAKNTAALNNANQLNQFPLQEKQAQSTKDLANIEAQFKSVMQTSSSASSLMSTTQLAVADVYRDPNLTPDAKEAVVDKIYASLQANLGLLGSMVNMDFEGLLTYE